jgi:hypothetical protein
MKYATARPYADPEKAARRILEIANAVNRGLKLAIERGWLKIHESGTFVTFTPAGAELFA